MMRNVLHPRSWPLALKVPLLVAFLMIAVAGIISHIVLQRLAEDQETNLRQLTESYLDGLSTALIPNVLRHDVWETFDILDRAKDRYSGVKGRYTVVTLVDGSVLAASDPRQFPVGETLPAELAGRFAADQQLVLDEGRGLAWVHRVLRQEGIDLGSIVAEIDISDLLRVRREVLLTLILANCALTLLFAALGYGLVRRMVRPISLLTDHVERIRDGSVVEIPHQHLQDKGTEFGRLFASFNAMAAALREREALAQRLAEEEKTAMLGKLASGMAHEVNNPLGGMLNVVDTLRSHGHDSQVRQRSLDLLERGLTGIRNVVRATLTAYKREDRPARLARGDIDDLQFLIQHEQNRRRIRLAWVNELAVDLEIDGAAVRQITLNLLLNACAAAPDGGLVELQVKVSSDDLLVAVSDEGPGLPLDVREFYRNPRLAARPPRGAIGLGVWTICHLVSRLAGCIDVKSETGRGSRITVVLPLTAERKLDAVA